MKSETAVHGYCINARLACMTLKCGERRGDKERRAGQEAKTGSKRSQRVDEVSGEAR